jgi:hypothetical protein
VRTIRNAQIHGEKWQDSTSSYITAASFQITNLFIVYLVMLSITQTATSCYLVHSGFLLGFFFDPEDGGDMFLLKDG